MFFPICVLVLICSFGSITTEGSICDPNPCGEGTCITMRGDDYSCICPADGFMYIHDCVTENCFPNPCKNDGVCIPLHGTSSYKCNCKDGYNGTNCETDINLCNPNPCKNGFPCMVNGGKEFCKCQLPYSGEKCEISPCTKNPCLNGGKCTMYSKVPKCECVSGFHGEICEKDCYCENGFCKKDSSGRNVCQCFPEYGLYSNQKCKACDCGKNANCTFERWLFKDDKYCLCPNGEELKNMRCKDTEYSTSTNRIQSSKTTETDYSTSTHRIESTKTTNSEYPTSTDWSKSSDTTRATQEPLELFSGTESLYTTDSSAWTEYTDITTEVCDCGNHSISCSFNRDGNKKCFCEPGFSQLFDTCIDCYCGEKSEGCSFDENKEKMCICNKGYAQDKEACKKTCQYDRECLNGGICKTNSQGDGFCECRKDFSGDKCEINDVCKHFDDICQRYGAVCIMRGGMPSCECPSDRKDVSGLCESICNPNKCIHGRCEIFGQNFKCRCEIGFGGKYCDSKLNPDKRDAMLFILFIICIVFLLVIGIGVLCITLHRCKKEAAAIDLERLINDTKSSKGVSISTLK